MECKLCGKEKNNASIIFVKDGIANFIFAIEAYNHEGWKKRESELKEAGYIEEYACEDCLKLSV